MIDWTKKEYIIENSSIKMLNSQLKFFDRDKEYKFTHLGKLGEGNYGIVDKYKVEIIGEKYNKSIILAGKSFKKYNSEKIKDYILKLFFIKNKFEKVGTLRILDTKFNKQKFVKNRNLLFNLIPSLTYTNVDLSEIIFITDLTAKINIKKIFPINIKNEINYNLFSYPFSKRKIIYDTIIEDIFLLYKNGLLVNGLDLWVIIEDYDNNIKPYILDIDKVVPIQAKKKKINLKEGFKTMLMLFLENDNFTKDYNYLLEIFNQKYEIIY